jgi:DNA-binding SARP family transcriptional activator
MSSHARRAGRPKRISLKILDAFDLELDGRGAAVPRAAQRVLVYLALADRTVDRHRLAGTLWPDFTETAALSRLRTVLWQLERAAPGAVMASMTRIGLASNVVVDAREVAAAAYGLLARDDPMQGTSAERLLSSRELLPDWSEEWVAAARERYRQLRLHALERLSQALTADGKYGPAIEAGLAAVEEEPLRESANRVLIEAFLAEGNWSEAMRQLEHYRQTIKNELGLEITLRLERVQGGLALQSEGDPVPNE